MSIRGQSGDMGRAEYNQIDVPRYVGSQIRKIGDRILGVERVIMWGTSGWPVTTNVSLAC